MPNLENVNPVLGLGTKPVAAAAANTDEFVKSLQGCLQKNWRQTAQISERKASGKELIGSADSSTEIRPCSPIRFDQPCIHWQKSCRDH